MATCVLARRAVDLAAKAASACAKTDAIRAKLAAQDRAWSDTRQDLRSMGVAVHGFGKAMGGALGSAAGELLTEVFKEGQAHFYDPPNSSSHKRPGITADARQRYKNNPESGHQ